VANQYSASCGYSLAQVARSSAGCGESIQERAPEAPRNRAVRITRDGRAELGAILAVQRPEHPRRRLRGADLAPLVVAPDLQGRWLGYADSMAAGVLYRANRVAR
jgi:predicted N-acetyltransferase YhbS